MPTVSAYTTGDLKRRIDRIIREEGRKQAQVGSTALELYARLPGAARRALLELLAAEAEGPTGAMDRAVGEGSRALLNAKWEITSQRIREAVAERGTLPAGELSEEEIADIAVQMTTGID
jgi:hypothetical protein